jgi:hypothetical protein
VWVTNARSSGHKGQTFQVFVSQALAIPFKKKRSLFIRFTSAIFSLQLWTISAVNPHDVMIQSTLFLLLSDFGNLANPAIPFKLSVLRHKPAPENKKVFSYAISPISLSSIIPHDPTAPASHPASPRQKPRIDPQ